VQDATPDAKNPQPGRISATDAVGYGPTELGHPIQDVAREQRLGLPPAWRPGSQIFSDDRLVPKDRILHARLPMVSRRLLPSSTSEYLHSLDSPIPRARPWSPPRHRRGLGWRNHDGRASRTGRVIERDGVVGRVGGYSRDVPVRLLNQTDARRRVIGRRIRDRLGDDDASAVDTEMQLLPATLAAFPVFRCGPLALADD